MDIFQYGQVEIDYLKQQDGVLGTAIDRIGRIERKVTLDPFASLVHSIVAQQISSKAAVTVWNRLNGVLGDVTPERIEAVYLEEIQSCGMSARKAGYLKGAGEAAVNGQVDFSAFGRMSDEEIIQQLSSLHGIGVWTAEMLLIFSLCRPNVVSWGDLAIRRGMMNLYGLTELKKNEFERYREQYSPYGSVASLYLWALS